MSLASSLLDAARRPFRREASSSGPDGRRQFVRQAVGAGAAALGAGVLLADDARAAGPGAFVDADGRYLPSGQAEPFIGEITLFGGNFAPRGWAFCQGQLLPISQNDALFSILGTTYGGDGRTTFALPDLRGRFPLQPGRGPGLPAYRLGERGGSPTSQLTVMNLPSHTHTPMVHSGVGTSTDPTGNAMGLAPGTPIYGNAPAGGFAMAPTNPTGGSQSFSNMPPYLALNFIIALFGVYPSRG